MLGREFSIRGTLRRRTAREHARLADSEPERSQRAVSVRTRHVAEARLERTGLACVNLGLPTTVEQAKPERLLELHLFDLDHEIYGEDVEVRFLRYLRGEQKFASLDELKAQIARDVEQAQSLT
jgi:FAD synthase